MKTPVFYTNPKDNYEMVLIPGGEFWMGSEERDNDALNDEKPRHLHPVASYYLGIYCVSVEQFSGFVAATGHDAGLDWLEGPVDHPVRCVNWHDANAYAKWSGLRLPTEAEWELAARGCDGRKYPWGNNWDDGLRVCWDRQKGVGGETDPRDAHPEGISPFGIYQMSGNIDEWCVDWYDEEVYQRYAQGDFTLPPNGGGRVLRGASWFGDNPRNFRGATRYYWDPDHRNPLRGFRLARSAGSQHL